MARQKRGVPKPKVPKGMDFTKSQQKLMEEMTTRHLKERDENLGIIFEEIGLDLKKETRSIQLRQDFSGLDFIEKPEPPKPDEPPKEEENGEHGKEAVETA